MCVPFIMSSCKSDDKQEPSSASATDSIKETESVADENVDNTTKNGDLTSTADESQLDSTETKKR